MPAEPVHETANVERRNWLSILAKAQPAEMIAAWDALAEAPTYSALRAPETGLVLVRGRMGGAGDAFNVGEMTVTRAAVRLLFEKGKLVEGDRVVITYGDRVGRVGGTNTLKLLSVGADGAVDTMRDL
jgi:phosphonate C-P lyase system protein PhnG